MQKFKPDLKIELGRVNHKFIKNHFQKWCDSTGQKFPKPSYGVFTDLRVSTGECFIYFLNDKECSELYKAVRRIAKRREKCLIDLKKGQ